MTRKSDHAMVCLALVFVLIWKKARRAHSFRNISLYEDASTSLYW